MRNDGRAAGGVLATDRRVNTRLPTRGPDHLGLAYDTWAPITVPSQPDRDDGTNLQPRELGKVPRAIRESWLDRLAALPIDDDYRAAFDRWKRSLDAPDTLTATLTLDKRLLLGHGNPSATEVGITVHHTWGVPVIPGSALKGLTAHYVAANYGPGPNELSGVPWMPVPGPTGERISFQGNRRDGNRILTGPGDVYRAIFGAPEADNDPRPASQGQVVFHDSLLDPTSVAGNKPFIADVMTVHQRTYYKQNELRRTGDWPNDYDSPIPIQFLTVRPDTQFLLALSGSLDMVALAAHFLGEAISHWGIGGKSSAGYGIGRIGAWTPGATIG